MTTKKEKSVDAKESKKAKRDYGSKSAYETKKPTWAKTKVVTGGEFFNFEKFGDSLDGIFTGTETFETGKGKSKRSQLVLCFDLIADNSPIKTTASYTLEKAFEAGKFVEGYRYYIEFVDVRGKQGVKIFDIFTDYVDDKKKGKKS